MVNGKTLTCFPDERTSYIGRKEFRLKQHISLAKLEKKKKHPMPAEVPFIYPAQKKYKGPGSFRVQGKDGRGASHQAASESDWRQGR